jgi:hypothetical protein
MQALYGRRQQFRFAATLGLDRQTHLKKRGRHRSLLSSYWMLTNTAI